MRVNSNNNINSTQRAGSVGGTPPKLPGTARIGRGPGSFAPLHFPLFVRLRIFVIALTLLTASLAVAEEREVLDFITINRIAIASGIIIKVENDQSVQKSETVKWLDYPPRTSMFGVRGKVKYHDVEGDAYIQVGYELPDDMVTSHNLEYFEQKHKIQGTGDWQDFELTCELPMAHKRESVPLGIFVVMPGKGSIELTDVNITDIFMVYADGTKPLFAGGGESPVNTLRILDGEGSKPIRNDVIAVENDQSAPKTVTVKTLEHRPTSSGYVVSGKVRYNDVEGDAYLEMWNHMPDGSKYFSRTLADFGPMRKIQGTSDWRTFELPFYLMELKPESVTLEINVVMPGKGTIELAEEMTIGEAKPMSVYQNMFAAVSNVWSGILPTMPPVEDDVIRVVNDQSVRKSETVITQKYYPKSSKYAVRGFMRFHDVEKPSYLEVWSILPNGDRYLNTFDASARSNSTWDRSVWARQQKISGTGGWREFEIPFDLKNAKPESVTLEICVVLPGKGTIELMGITINDMPLSDYATVAGEWFSNRARVGGWFGFLWGCYGGLFGCLAGFLVPRGKGRRLMMGMIIFPVLAGIVHLTVGITAFLVGQPFHVCYPFVLVGVGLLFAFSFAPMIRRGYAQAEQRRMQALDA